MMDVDESSQRRFWSKVALPDENGCMLWLGNLYQAGYGRLKIRGVKFQAHRVALLLAVGEPPEPSMHSAHACRNKHCVAPAHLRWATPSENEADKLRDGTDNRGESHGRAKLTASQVTEMRRLSAEGWSQNRLAREFGVSQTHVGDIVRGKRWGHLLDEAS